MSARDALQPIDFGSRTASEDGSCRVKNDVEGTENVTEAGTKLDSEEESQYKDKALEPAHKIGGQQEYDETRLAFQEFHSSNYNGLYMTNAL